MRLDAARRPIHDPMSIGTVTGAAGVTGIGIPFSSGEEVVTILTAGARSRIRIRRMPRFP
ncbi:hypothetical protein GCM10023147_50190 [Tsukamurella soli]|uniref:Uncharacterized protein n=1 Tax=Tsukamurella soli TaxID=644556 RepID=A0ABP8KH14_9ACTN